LLEKDKRKLIFCFINVKSLEVTVNLISKADGVASVVFKNVFILLGIASGSPTARVAL
jgi:hypothetical protein